MHDKKVNTKTTGVPPTESKNIVLKTSFGELNLPDAMAAHDHANMKAREMMALLTLASGGGRENFSLLNGDLQNSLLWMLQQSASELDQLLGQVEFSDVEVTK